MRLNYETVLVGDKCILLPYRKEHVGQYHSWMQDAQLLEATASEPLSLEEEYEMQESWRDDPLKCTFIVLARDAVGDKLELLETKPSPLNKADADDTNDSTEFDGKSEHDIDKTRSNRFLHSTLSAMAGDVNLFVSDEDMDKNDEADGDIMSSKNQQAVTVPRRQAEIDIMIAEERFRRTGMGRESTCLMMYYGATQMGLRRLFCKIKDDNAASLALFQSLGFTQCNYAECFREYELELRRDTNEELVQVLSELLGLQFKLQTYRCPIAP
jgi:RimJ/RimL family protein N-acetyltransferase